MGFEPPPTPDEVFANNLRSERGSRGWSRKRLAQEASVFASEQWSEWRIIDLEGARTGSPPAAPRWHEVISLSLAMACPIWDLVIPSGGDDEILIYERQSEDGESTDRLIFSTEDLVRALTGALPETGITHEAVRQAMRANTDHQATDDLLERFGALEQELRKFMQQK